MDSVFPYRNSEPADAISAGLSIGPLSVDLSAVQELESWTRFRSTRRARNRYRIYTCQGHYSRAPAPIDAFQKSSIFARSKWTSHSQVAQSDTDSNIFGVFY